MMQRHTYNHESGVIPLIMLIGMILIICVVGAGVYTATDHFTSLNNLDLTKIISNDNAIVSPSSSSASGGTIASQKGTATENVSEIPNTTSTISVQNISNGNDLDKISQDLNNTNIDSIDSQTDQLKTDSQGM